MLLSVIPTSLCTGVHLHVDNIDDFGFNISLFHYKKGMLHFLDFFFFLNNCFFSLAAPILVQSTDALFLFLLFFFFFFLLLGAQ